MRGYQEVEEEEVSGPANELNTVHDIRVEKLDDDEWPEGVNTMVTDRHYRTIAICGRDKHGRHQRIWASIASAKPTEQELSVKWPRKGGVVRSCQILNWTAGKEQEIGFGWMSILTFSQ